MSSNLDLFQINLHDYQMVIINSSAGKDSLCCLYQINAMAEAQGYPRHLIHVSHQDLGEAEWGGTSSLAKRQADSFGFSFHIIRRVDKDGREESLLEYADRRGKWPSSKQRWCTSDFKRDPGAKILRALTKDLGECQVLYVFGFRIEESPSRAKKQVLSLNKRLSTKTRTVHEYLPIHTWSTAKVWDVIKSNGLEYHKAYDLGMPRLSCCFCIFSPFDALVIAGIHNPELLDKYIEVETRIDHTFKNDLSLAEIKTAIESGYKPGQVGSWRM